jgi:hypothetical protein
MTKLFNRFHIFLSHHSYLYAAIAGIGIVLFWRGVWHTTDSLHLYLNHYGNSLTISGADHPWWDGPLSFVVGCIILALTRAFVSSFIGNELILSGLRAEKRMTKVTEDDVKTEVSTITDIKHTLAAISRKLEELEVQVKDHHQK